MTIEEKEIIIKKLRIFAIFTRAKEIQEEKQKRILSFREPLIISNTYEHIKVNSLSEFKSGKEKRRERRLKARIKK